MAKERERVKEKREEGEEAWMMKEGRKKKACMADQNKNLKQIREC